VFVVPGWQLPAASQQPFLHVVELHGGVHTWLVEHVVPLQQSLWKLHG
jgi:hypothetical protein